MATTCHYCSHDASARCTSCGLWICRDHGDKYCQVCSGAVFSKEKASDQREERLFLQCPPKPMMQTIYLDDDDGPPQCYACPSLARFVCQNCHALFCRDHGRKAGFCDACMKAARFGNWMIAALLLVLAIFAVVAFLVNQG
jgi:hypothetical protein